MSLSELGTLHLGSGHFLPRGAKRKTVFSGSSVSAASRTRTRLFKQGHIDALHGYPCQVQRDPWTKGALHLHCVSPRGFGGGEKSDQYLVLRLEVVLRDPGWLEQDNLFLPHSLRGLQCTRFQSNYNEGSVLPGALEGHPENTCAGSKTSRKNSAPEGDIGLKATGNKEGIRRRRRHILYLLGGVGGWACHHDPVG